MEKYLGWIIASFIISGLAIYTNLNLHDTAISVFFGMFFFIISIFKIPYILLLEKNFRKLVFFAFLQSIIYVFHQYISLNNYGYVSILAYILIFFNFYKKNISIDPFKDTAINTLSNKEKRFLFLIFIIYLSLYFINLYYL